jgi:hypothetical protein
MPLPLHSTVASDYLSLAQQHKYNQSDPGSLARFHGYLFTGFVLLLPIVRSHVRDCHQPDHGDELVIETKKYKRKDVKGKGRMREDIATASSNLLTGDDMIVLVSRRKDVKRVNISVGRKES